MNEPTIPTPPDPTGTPPPVRAPDPEPPAPGLGMVSGDAAPTVVDVRVKNAVTLPPRESGLDTGSKTGSKTGARTNAGSRSTSVVTARETLLIQEIAQTRAFLRLAMALAVATSIAITFLGGDPLAKKILYGALASVVVVCGWLAWLLRDDEAYSVSKVMISAAVSVSAAFAAIYYFGVFSPAVVIIPFGLCFFSSGGSTEGTLFVYLLCALSELFLGVLVTAGILPDRGVVKALAVSPVDKLAMLTLIEAIFLATFAIMRASRAATLEAIELHDRALAQISQREALLKEARQDLAQALKANGVGRYSEHTLGGFKLADVIGRGAMGEVYEAVHVQRKTGAAVKVLLDHVLAQPEHVERFHREARIAASLDVPNVVRVLAVADVDAAIPYIAMERLHGMDLADWLREHRRMSAPRLVTLLRQLGAGLEAARVAGIVHRDLKPRNVFLAKEEKGEVWKILDFGVSKQLNEEHTLTRDRIVGTPNYMAPEQIDHGAITHKTDIFALGVIAYRALTGRPAFTGDTESQILYRVVHAMPPKPSDVIAASEEIDVVLAVALAKSPADRFDSGLELAEALDAAARGVVSPDLQARAARVLARHPWGS